MPAVNKLLGNVPYLNGGLFERHQIEDLHGKNIQIPDVAFDRLFAFFKEYQWHLDERPDRDDREINPDVLGYIFEKYINQKQMGAYYTKEDITEYISKNTIIPFLFDAAKKRCAVAFESDGYIWRLIRENPDRYLHEAVRRGSDRDLPPEIAAGLVRTGNREKWNQSTPYEDEPETFLPTETWREFIARRRRHCEIRESLVSGAVVTIKEFITLNADIRQFAEDVIQYSEGPELVRAFYKSISTVSVLDPTCGSGAFLFAALNVLKPLYEACLKRMDAFVEEWEAKPGKSSPEMFKDFREILTECRKHRNQEYFVLKSIIVNNLYGVDIMEEAVEICKLRLFLKLVAQVDTQEGIEPLPDIDFNIRAGNTLVGYVRYGDVERAVASKFDFGGAMAKIEDKAKILDSAVDMFRQQQTRLNGTVTIADKLELRKRFAELEEELDDFLAAGYGVKPKKIDLEAWKSRSKPFHWFSHFHRIMTAGGFDVVIGNPPYIEYQKVKGEYTLLDEYAPFLGNLYAACSYRANSLLSEAGYLSFIVPVSLPSTDRMAPLRELISKRHSVYYVSFSTRPQKLFDGAEQRLTIYVQVPSPKPALFSGGFVKWSTQERLSLFQRIAYVQTQPVVTRNRIWPKINGQIQAAIFEKVMRLPFSIASLAQGSGGSLYYKNTGLRYFNTVTLRPPKCWINGKSTSSSRETVLSVQPTWKAPVHAVLLSSLFFSWYQVLSNCRDLNPSDIATFPIPKELRGDPELAELSKRAEADYSSKAKIITMNNKLTGKVELESMSPAKSKLIIDEIDTRLAIHYGLTDEERDDVINYDIKYRIGADETEE